MGHTARACPQRLAQGNLTEGKSRSATLRYDWAYRLRSDFPSLTIVVNGGISTTAQVQDQLLHVDGVMLGREAYHNPWWLASWDAVFYGAGSTEITRERIEQEMCDYMTCQAAEHGTPWPTMARHILGLRHGLPGARHWHQVWSDHRLRDLSAQEVMALAHAPVQTT